MCRKERNTFFTCSLSIRGRVFPCLVCWWVTPKIGTRRRQKMRVDPCLVVSDRCAHVFELRAYFYSCRPEKSGSQNPFSTPKRIFFGGIGRECVLQKKAFDALGHARLAAGEGDYAKWTLSCLSALISSIFADLFLTGGKTLEVRK